MPSKSGTDGSKPNALVALLILGITVGIGVTAGLVAFQATGANPGPEILFEFGTREMPLQLGTLGFLAVGGLAGLVIGYAALGVGWARRLFHGLLGIYVGAWAGLIIFTIGYITAVAPAAWMSSDLFRVAAEALFSLSPWEFFAAGMGAVLGLMVERYAWRFDGLLAFVSLAAVVFGFIGYSLFVTLPTVPPSAFPLSLTLFIAEAGMLLLVLVYAFYPLDMLGRKRWDRTRDKVQFDPDLEPKVAFHVPTFNEPPEMVKETLRSLMAVDYPEDKYTIMVLDDSTEQGYVEPVREFCEANGITYIHRGQREGYKAGALNVGLEYTPDEYELIAVIDADYQIQPDYLKDTTGYFDNPDIGFLQTPQDYRNRDESFLTKYYYYADSYFYQAVLPSRNEADAIIFCGTMGIVRRTALEEVNGWSKDHVTEDAELATRLLGAGWEALYVNESYGHGLIPESYEGYRAQHHRWSFGGGQLLRTRTGHILSSRFSLRQKFDHLAGVVHWYDGVFIVTISMILLMLVMGDLFGYNIVTHHQREMWMVGLIPIFLLVEAMTRVQLALGQHFDLSFKETIRVMGMWFSVKFSNTWGALKGLVGIDMPFIRTPKGDEGSYGRLEAVRRSLRAAPFETGMAALMSAASLAFLAKTVGIWLATGDLQGTRFFLGMWVGLFGLAFGSAPIYAYKAHRDLGGKDEEPEPVVEEQPDVSAPGAGAKSSGQRTIMNPSDASAAGPGPVEDDEPSPWRLPDGWHLGALVAILLVALALRLKDPLSSGIIGAEDPYTHMMRTWDLVQYGQLPDAYPPGFAALLAPLTLLSSDGLYWVLRFTPPLFGVIEVLGIFYLCRYGLSETSALGGAFVAAVMPENIFRTELMFPTALDLAILPFAFLLLFRSVEGHRSSRWALGAITLFLLIVHPWIVGLAIPPILLFLFLTTDRDRGKVLTTSVLLAGLGLAAFYVLPGTWNPFPDLMRNVSEKLAVIAAQPSSLWTDMPRHVDLAHMLTIPVLVLGALGAGVALVRRSRVGLFALSWTLLLLPIVLVDWFDKWFIPHRTVAFLSLGFALLGAVFFEGLGWMIPERKQVRRAVAVVLGVGLVLGTLPAASATQTWYRIYDEDDYAVWEEVDERDPSIVITASWQTHHGYRAMTGGATELEPSFYYDEEVRNRRVEANPDLIVLYDSETAGDAPDDFLQNWTVVAQQGDVTAYAPYDTSR